MKRAAAVARPLHVVDIAGLEIGDRDRVAPVGPTNPEVVGVLDPPAKQEALPITGPLMMRDAAIREVRDLLSLLATQPDQEQIPLTV